MQKKYIKDFSELEKMLLSDVNFVLCACNGYEDRELLRCIIRVMYSIYLTFQYQKGWTRNDVEKYVDIMLQYLKVGKTTQYHYINTVKIAIEHHDTMPMYYATIGAILVEEEGFSLFGGLSAMVKACGTLERVFGWFEENEQPETDH